MTTCQRSGPENTAGSPVTPMGLARMGLAATGAAWGLVGLGVALRLWHYLSDHSIWQDEAALVLNVIGKDFGELLGPLFFSEAAPPLFLWMEKAVHLLLGDSTWALRLLPCIASCLAMLLMLPLARRSISVKAVPWALMLFAVSDRLLWHACEAKQYAVDVLVAAGLLLLYQGATGSFNRRLIIAAAVAPVAIWLSYPACFLYGGLLLAWLPAVWTQARGRAWLGYAAVAASVFAAFGLMLAGPVRAQRNHEIVSCWIELGKFPDWQRPATIPFWIIESTLELVDYCCRPVGHVLTVLAVLGAVPLARQGRRGLLVAMLAPVGLALAAALMMAHPYGGVRVLAYAAPAVILLVAEGAVTAQAWLGTRHRLAGLALLAVLAAPAARTACRAVFPWNRADSAGAAAYVLAHRRADDPVMGNDWDYQYLFRHLDSKYFRPLVDGAFATDGRMWVIITAGTLEERRRIAGAFPPNAWQVLDRRQFARTDVLLLEPHGPSFTAGAGGPVAGRR